MSDRPRPIAELPNAPGSDQLADRLAGAVPAVFLDYRGTVERFLDTLGERVAR